MQQLLDWTLQAIRAERSDFSWMEELRFDWTPLVSDVVEKIIEGQTVLLLTDKEREWFLRYILNRVNHPSNNRPFFPIYPLKSLFFNLPKLKSDRDLDILEDMLDISFPRSYLIWYIGKGDTLEARIAKRAKSNFLWLFDDESAKALKFNSNDALLDIKLLQLYKLFDMTLEASLFNEITLR